MLIDPVGKDDAEADKVVAGRVAGHFAGLVDELFLSLAPKLTGGEDVTGEALRIIAGATFSEQLELELLGVLENGSHLFLRYGVGGSA